uniref:hypothetical protein n=1 Tax=Pedobacter sp. TaxID=1411316 RepID=UPI0015EF88FE|nr:hypothetical protein [Pedobacter sp.]
MNLIANYPKNERKVKLYVKYPVQISASILQLCKKKYLLSGHYLKVGQWVAADVMQDGYSVPHTANAYDTEGECQKVCDAHNLDCGWSVSEIEEIINQSNYNAIHQN